MRRTEEDVLPTPAADLAHLLRRAGFGGTQTQIDALTPLELPAIVDQLLNANLGIRVIGVNLGRFDTHSDQPTWHADLTGDLDASVGAFFDTLGTSFQSRVSLMTFSEFGRRPEDNDTSGTDHATAAAHFVIGDRVAGGPVGDAPSLTALDNNANLVNTVDFRQLYATMIDTWLKADSQQVLGYNFGSLPRKTGGPGGTGGTGGGGTPTTPVRPFRRLRKRLTAA